MRRYPEYKASGVEFIGEIPKDWEVKKIKYTQSNLIGGVWGKEPEGAENDIYCIRVADFDYAQLAISTHNLTLRNISLKERSKRTLSVGDLLVEKSGGGEKSPVGRTVMFDGGISRPSVTSNFISKFTAKSELCFPRYLLYCLSFLYQIGLTRKHIKQSTGLQNLDIDSYFQERIPFPSLVEQAQIADFLDRKTGQIDELIRIKERQIELLQEKHTALINQVVTKGLDPNVEMKPSGEEWIGEIPAHWEVTQIKQIAQFIGGYSEFGSESYTDRGIPIFRIGDIAQFIKMEDVKRVPIEQVKRLKQNQLCYGDTLIVMIGRRAGESIYYAFDYPSILSAQVAGLRAIKADSKFLFYFIHSASFLNTITPLFFGATRDNISKTALMNVKIPFPSGREQIQIVNFLDRKTGQIDELIAIEGRKVELLKEYRQSLIFEAVTGKINVRGDAVTESSAV